MWPVRSRLRQPRNREAGATIDSPRVRHMRNLRKYLRIVEFLMVAAGRLSDLRLLSAVWNRQQGVRAPVRGDHGEFR